MRNRKNKILLAAVCVCLLAVTAFGTLAYFTAQNTAENSFMVAGYDQNNPDKDIDPDELFSIKVTETTPEDDPKIEAVYAEDEDGNPLTDKDGNPIKIGNKYIDIAPGDELPKDPAVVNTGKYGQWVRVQVTLTNASAWKAAAAAHENLDITDLTAIANEIDADKWTLDGTVKEENNTLVWTYYLKEELAPNGTAKLFDTVTIPVELTVEEMISLKEFKLTVAAEAIQSKNTGDPEDPDNSKKESAKYAFGHYWEEN